MKKLQLTILSLAFVLVSNFSFAQFTSIGNTILSCNVYGFESVAATGTSLLTTGVESNSNVPNILWGGPTLNTNNMVFSYRTLSGTPCSVPLVIMGENINGTNFQFGLAGSGAVTGAWLILSDRRVKENVQEISNAVDLVQQLNGVSYNYKHDAAPGKSFPKGRVYGFIAQEVQEVIPEATATYPDSDLIGVKYTEIIPLLTEAIKEQQTTISNLENRLATLEKVLSPDTDASVSDSKRQWQTTQEVKLQQNRPNPFDQTTTIDYSLPANIKTANLEVFDLNGKLIKSIPVTDQQGSVDIDASQLENGTYVYAINANGKTIAAKLMIIQK